MLEDPTWNDEAAASSAPRVRLLTRVLDYDDLLADRTTTLRLDPHPTPITIGRASDGRFGFRSRSALRLPDRWLSTEHAVLSTRGEEIVIRDAGSKNGTHVNGERITERELGDGDLIEVGHTLLCYRMVAGPLAEALDQEPDARRIGPTVTACPEVAALCRDLARIAPSVESVQAIGETGAGKESVAETVHRLSGRQGALCVVDCSAIPETLFESTFFGHRRGAFTGATEACISEIQRADGGTLFLDEVGNLGPAAQAKLLRVIEDGRVVPLGATEPLRVDVRWVSATNRALFDDASAFRPDLLRRLAGYVARLPPLRRRREDLGRLTTHLLAEAGVKRAAITSPAARRLYCGGLPGNIRQLRSALRSAALLAGDRPIDLAHMQGEPATSGAVIESAPGPARRRRGGTPTPKEIESALEQSAGNVVRAAGLLETSSRQLYRWIERHAIPLDRYRR
ncbi:MAG: FHA domain-containing protein [Myxococcales bacterium]|nr:FHA domain-containing protein [Myxococcales bacterium]